MSFNPRQADEFVSNCFAVHGRSCAGVDPGSMFALLQDLGEKCGTSLIFPNMQSCVFVLILVVLKLVCGRLEPGLFGLHDTRVNVMIVMKEDTRYVLKQVDPNLDREARIMTTVQGLKQFTEISQKFVRSNLHALKDTGEIIDFESFWINNALFVQGATKQTILNLEADFGARVDIRLEIMATRENIEVHATNASNDGPWGVSKMDANQVWADGITGEGIIVATIDSGVAVDHEILKQNYVGSENYGWYNPYLLNDTTPNDARGHGTHTMGTLAGANGYGVAPGSKWMSCKGCNGSRCTESALLSCGQFILCPHDIHGKNPNCAFAPHVVSNSWGTIGNQNYYRSVVNAWKTAGILPVFASGNEGPYCMTVNSPSDYDTVLSIGSLNANHTLSTFSSVGPSKQGIRKPDFSAPGHRIQSAWSTTPTSYKTTSGTSMATPHVAGVIALLLSKDINLTYDNIYHILIHSCRTTQLIQPTESCNFVQGTPNNMNGWGFVNALEAMFHLNSPPTKIPPMEPFCRTDYLKKCVKNCTFLCANICKCA